MYHTRKPRSNSLPAKSTNKIPHQCYFYRKGFCKWGQFCKFIHKRTYVEKQNLPKRPQFTPPVPQFDPDLTLSERLALIRGKLREMQVESYKSSIPNQPTLTHQLTSVRLYENIIRLPPITTTEKSDNCQPSQTYKDIVRGRALSPGWDLLLAPAGLPNTKTAFDNLCKPRPQTTRMLKSKATSSSKSAVMAEMISYSYSYSYLLYFLNMHGLCAWLVFNITSDQSTDVNKLDKKQDISNFFSKP